MRRAWREFSGMALPRALMAFPRTLKVVGSVAIVALFFFGTLFAMDRYEVAARKAGIENVTLKPPFQPVAGSKLAFIAPAEKYSELTDTPALPERSPFILFENDREIGPPHSSYSSVVTTGKGRFLHWVGHGFIFSASDNSDPNTNGRTYRAVRVR